MKTPPSMKTMETELPHPPLPREDLTVEFERSNGVLVQGLVVAAQSDFDDARITVDFSEPEALDLPVDSRLSVRFDGGPLSASHQASGSVVFRSSDRIRERYQFLFPGAAERALAPVVNSRGAVRAQPDADDPAEVVLHPWDLDEDFPAKLLDISGLGVSILVDPETEARISSCWKIRLALTLPGEACEIRLSATIRYRQKVEGGIKYGIRYSPADSIGFENLQARIYRYVMALHSRSLRQRQAS
jgi:hypothetical protein